MIRYRARWVLPVAGQPVRDGMVVTSGARIEWAGAQRDAPAYPVHTDVELGNSVLLPGLVNAHVHLDLAPFAQVLDERSFFPWVRAIASGTAEAMDDADRAHAARWSAIDQLEHGVTTMADTSPTRSAFDAMVASGARGIAYLETFGPDAGQRDAAFADLRARVEAVRGQETALVRVGVSPHAPYSVSDALYRTVADYARTDSLPVAVHIAESEAESMLVERGTGEFAGFLLGRRIPVAPRAASSLALLDRQRVLAARPLCIHCVRAGGDDVLRIADNGARIAHCPLSNRWFAHGEAPLALFRSHRIPVGLGTDSAASNDDMRLLGEACAAADGSLTPHDRIALATAGGARALGIEDGTGTLVAGAPADLAAFAIADTDDADSDPARYLLERCAQAPASLVVVAGVVRVRDGRGLGRDAGVDDRLQAIRTRVRAWAAGAGWRVAREPF